MRRVHLTLSLLLLSVGFPLQGEEKWSKPPGPPPRDGTRYLYGGTVTDVTKSSITIQWPGEQPKSFAVSEDLTAGRVPMKGRVMPNTPRGYSVMPQFMYRLTDVKVGDMVVIYHAHIGNLDICDHICIQKRPGGRVPPLPEEAEKLINPVEIIKAKLPPGTPLPKSLRDAVYIPYHEKQNAYWDLEDKGIPYPEKFGEMRRWPAAPMPREVKP